MPRRNERGFTLVETLAAITVFAIMTLGVAPILAASLRGSTLSRSYTKGKNVASEAMERVRGLPYFVTSATQIDVLDIYFPNAAGAVDGVYTTICTPTDESRACPAGAVPSDHVVTYEAAFVRKTAGSTTPEQYEVVAPPGDYSWDTATKPPEPLLRMAITAAWPVGDEERTYRLASLIGDRRFGGLKIDGAGVVEYGVQVLTSFRNDEGQESGLSVVGAAAESRVESKLLTTADQDVSAARLLLTDRTVPLDASAEVMGANDVLTAPPNGDVVDDPSEGALELLHADLDGVPVAGVGPTSITALADVTSDLPRAAGTLSATDLTNPVLWAAAQAEVGDDSPLRLRDEQMMAWVRTNPVSALPALEAATSAATQPLETQQVATNARVRIGSFLLLPTTFIQDTSAEGAVVEVREFVGETNCVARPVTGSASASWSATLRYWQDPPDTLTEITPGSYAEVLLGGTAGAANLEDIQADPPIVYEDPTNPDPAGSRDDIYLFRPDPDEHLHDVDDDGDPTTPADNDDEDQETPDPQVQHNHRSYLADWSALAEVSVDAAQPQINSAGINGAIRITTNRTDPDYVGSVLNVNIGSLSCRALDAR